MVFCRCISSYPNNDRIVKKNFPEPFGSLNTIHYWHIEVSKYELIPPTKDLGVGGHLKSFRSIHAKINLPFYVKVKFEHHGLHRGDAKLFVINYQDSALRVFFKGFHLIDKFTKWHFFRGFHNLDTLLLIALYTLSLVLLLGNLIKFLEFEGEEKRTTFLVFGNEVDISLELLNNKLTYDETKSNALDINLFSFILDWAKHLK